MRERWINVDFPFPHNKHQQDPEAVIRCRDHYAAIIENIDYQVGRFLDMLRKRISGIGRSPRRDGDHFRFRRRPPIVDARAQI
jgi:hypothetical protein